VYQIIAPPLQYSITIEAVVALFGKIPGWIQTFFIRFRNAPGFEAPLCERRIAKKGSIALEKSIWPPSVLSDSAAMRRRPASDVDLRCSP